MDIRKRRLEIIRESVVASMGECRMVDLEGSKHSRNKLKILTNRFIEETRAHASELNESEIDEYTRLQIEAELLANVEVETNPRNRLDFIQTKLPKLQLTKYHGDYLKWTEFWDRFHSSIDSQNLPNADKFAYLQATLGGEALATIRGLDTTNENYTIALQLLKERFGKPGLVLDAHYVALTKLKRATLSPKDWLDTFNEIERHLRILKAMGENINNNHLRSLIISKFPEELIYELRSKIKTEEETVEIIRKNLEHIITAKITTTEAQEPISTVEALHIREQKNTERNNKRISKRKFDNRRSKTTCLTTPENKKTKLAPCVFCDGNHYNDQCTKTIAERKQLMKDRCFKCLMKGHTAKVCSRKKKCFHCKSFYHNSAICQNRGNETKTLHLRNKLHTTVTMLQTAIIELYGTDNKMLKCRALFDTGSQRSYITSLMANKLSLPVTDQNYISVYTFGSNQPNEIQSTSTEVKIRDVKVKMNIIPYITENIECPDDTLLNSLPAYVKEKMADDGSLGKHVDILIGNDYYHTFILEKRIKLQEQLFLVNSIFGWILSGIVQDENGDKEKLSVLTYVQGEPLQVTDTLLDKPMQQASIYKLWDLETLGISDCPKATRDDQAVEDFNKTVTFRDGRYWIKWPWCRQPSELPENRGVAYGRLVGLLKRIDHVTLKNYDSVLQDQMVKGVIEKVDAETPVGHKVHYLPHHHVLKDGKLRIVYDASTKSKGQYSLNECLYRGPVLMENLIGLIIRFRSYQFGVLADVEKAFLQLGLQESDRDVTRFLWINDINKEPTKDNILHLRFTRVPFGIGCSPFLLAITLKHHLQVTNPGCVRLAQDIYVDNLVSGGNSTEECLQLYQETKKTFEKISMRMREWYTNNKTLQETVDKELRGKHCGMVTVLGINWCIDRDVLSLKLNEGNNASDPITKRKILTQISSVFDPCGYVSPLLIRAKLFLQNLWQKKVDWDTALPIDAQLEWRDITEQMKEIEQIEIPRWYGGGEYSNEKNNIELHCYVDASVNAYAAVAYLKIKQNDTIKVSLIMSKTRLTPIKNRPSHTIPRLELLGVLIGCRLLKFIKTRLPVTITGIYLWTDSQITLQWINSKKVLPPFVSARVNEINKNKEIEFRYVPTNLNPADIATRPCQNLASQKQWYEGPQYLKEEKSNWPKNLSLEHAMVTRITNEDNNIIKEIQKTHFPEETMGKTTSLSRGLGLFMDEGILRCRGRFKRTDWPENQKYPILIPKNTDFTRDIIEDTHRNLHHVGVGQTLANIRLTYWIPCGRSQVQKVLQRCKECRKYGGGPFKNPPIAPLPKERINLVTPFTYTGTDYLGPLYVINEKDNTMEKRWICIYTCLAIRALHLEVVQDMTAEECLLAMRRFIATRGLPHAVLSDNATHYKLTADVMQSEYCIKNKLVWKFIPELAPWWGGAYERLVGLVKHCLKRTIDKHVLNNNQLTTIVKEVEAVLNLRPLTTVGKELEHVLTPENFLRAGGLYTTTEPSEEVFLEPATEIKNNLIEGWKKGQDILADFKKMFINQYLTALREREAHANKKGPRIVAKTEPRIGEIVQIREDGPRIRWKVGKIETLIESEDKQIRVAIVKLPGGERLRRSITHLYPLEVEGEEQEDEVEGEEQEDEVEVEEQEVQVEGEEQEAGIQREQQEQVQSEGRPKRSASRKAQELIKKWIGLL